MVNAGRVAIVPQGEWSADATYKRLDAVTHNNTLYFAKKEVPAGTATSNTEYWSKSIVGGAGAIATTEAAGIVKPDGTTITIDDDGTIHGQSEITVDGTTITLDEAKGIISLAKTLQDKINTIENKLPKTSVVNNNTTTQAGLALDARQANPNIAGTLAANILQLNNDWNKSHLDCLWTGKANNRERVDFSSPLSDYPNARRLLFAFRYDEVNNEVICDIPIFDAFARINYIVDITELRLSIVPADQIYNTFCYLTWTSTKAYYLRCIYVEY